VNIWKPTARMKQELAPFSLLYREVIEENQKLRLELAKCIEKNDRLFEMVLKMRKEAKS